jgi:hypothetical protein
LELPDITRSIIPGLWPEQHCQYHPIAPVKILKIGVAYFDGDHDEGEHFCCTADIILKIFEKKRTSQQENQEITGYMRIKTDHPVKIFCPVHFFMD